MSSILSKAKDALHVSKSEGMTGIGSDQSALKDDSEMTLEGYESKYGKPSEEAIAKSKSNDASEGKSGIGADQFSKLGPVEVDTLPQSELHDSSLTTPLLTLQSVPIRFLTEQMKTAALFSKDEK